MSQEESLREVAAVWGLSGSEVASLGPWPGQEDDLKEATALLVEHLKPERIPSVVRRPAARLGGRALLDLALAGEPVSSAARDMFDWTDTQA